MRKRMRMGSVNAPGSGRKLERALNDAARAIRQHLDTTKVLKAAVEAAHPMLGSRRSSAWLTTGKEQPRLAHAIDVARGAFGTTTGSAPPPATVVEAASKRRAVLNDLTGSLAIPIIGPRAGLIAVLAFESTEWSAEVRDFAERLAYETALALETAHLFERAVSEKEKSEAILARVGDAVVVTDPRGTVHEWNHAAEKVFRRPSETSIGHRCEAILGLHRGEQGLACAAGCPLIGRPSDDGALGEEVWRDRGDGRRQPLLATAEAVRDADGDVLEVVHSFRDITRLKEADEAKTLFLATASHELKTPLTVIQGFTQTLLDRDPPPELRQQALRMIERRAVELNEIVNRLLLSSRIEAGQMQLTLAEIDVLSIVRERVLAMSNAIERPVGLTVADDIPLVIADGSAIAVIIDHLLDNATKYSPGGEPIRVAVTKDKFVEISVADEGIGMDADQVARCFEKFWQAESSDIRRFGGTGIGLYIVKSLVEAMGGEVRVASEPGSGTTFTINLMPVGSHERVGQEASVSAVEEKKRPDPGRGEQSSIREFMRQIGVPVRRDK